MCCTLHNVKTDKHPIKRPMTAHPRAKMLGGGGGGGGALGGWDKMSAIERGMLQLRPLHISLHPALE